MAKGKKPAIVRATKGFGTKTVDINAELQRIDRTFFSGHQAQAYQEIQAFCKKYPGQMEAYQRMASIALEIDDNEGYCQACAKVMALYPNDEERIYTLALGLYAQGDIVIAARLFSQAIALAPDNSQVPKIQEFLDKIQPALDKILVPLHWPENRETALDIIADHEWAQIHLRWGEYDQCRILEQQVLIRKPGMTAALNNLSLIAYIQDNLTEAIQYCEQVLEIESENIHALSNLIRYLVISGQNDRAQALGKRLQASHLLASNAWQKKFEGLSYLGDDGAIVKLWQELQPDKAELKILPAMGFHFVAVALARQGDITEAKKLWHKALQQSPNLKVAQDNLKNLSQPQGNHHSAWPFTADHWMFGGLQQAIAKYLPLIIETPVDERKKVCQRFLRDYPGLIYWIAIILDRGDPASCAMAAELARHADTQELWDILKTFALGQSGSDQLRNQMANRLVQADQLEPEQVRMWMQGKWQEVFLLNYEFHEESPEIHTPQVQALLIQALTALKTYTKAGGVEAEALLKEALSQKVSPDLLQNLAAAYEIQDRNDEAVQLCHQIVADYPNYIPATAAVALYHLKNYDIDQAAALLKPILKRKRFHFDDFVAFSNVYMHFLVQQENMTAASGWLQIWKQVTPDDSELKTWEKQMLTFDLRDRALRGLNELKELAVGSKKKQGRKKSPKPSA
jgi:tetratricopeptide (TPR) repeat protein